MKNTKTRQKIRGQITFADQSRRPDICSREFQREENMEEKTKRKNSTGAIGFKKKKKNERTKEFKKTSQN